MATSSAPIVGDSSGARRRCHSLLTGVLLVLVYGSGWASEIGSSQDGTEQTESLVEINQHDTQVSSEESSEQDTAGTNNSPQPPAAEPEDASGAHESVAELPGNEDAIEAYLLDTPEELVFLEQQIHSGESTTAQRQLDTIVQQIESSLHRYHPDLTVPLTLSGDAHMVRGEYAEALQFYDRARHVARVSTGLFDVGQLPIVYREANAHRRTGNLKAASQREEYAYEVAKKAFGNYHTDGLPALYRLANFYIHVNHFVAARSLYNRALAIHATARQDNTLQAIPALQGIAKSHRLTRFPPYYVNEGSEQSPLAGPTPGLTTGELSNQHVAFNDFPAGERALQQIIEIRQNQQPEDKEAIVEALLDLADWHLLFDRANTAKTLYTHVYESLVEDGQSTARFDTPELIYFPTPEDPRAPDFKHPQDPVTGRVTLGFEVSSAGHVRKLKTLESVPDGLMDFRVRRSMRLAVYRPRLVDGLSVTTEAQTYTYSFTYYPEKSPPSEDKSPAGEPAGEKVPAEQFDQLPEPIPGPLPGQETEQLEADAESSEAASAAAADVATDAKPT